jgi:hypothetical protein
MDLRVEGGASAFVVRVEKLGLGQQIVISHFPEQKKGS